MAPARGFVRGALYLTGTESVLMQRKLNDQYVEFEAKPMESSNQPLEVLRAPAYPQVGTGSVAKRVFDRS